MLSKVVFSKGTKAQVGALYKELDAHRMLAFGVDCI